MDALPPGVRAGARLGPAEHLTQRRDFAALRQRGRRGGDSCLRVMVGPNDLAWSRIACAVPRRYGNAVARNKLRRLYREAFRLEKRRIPAGYDILVSPPRSSQPVALTDIRESLVRCIRKVAQRLERARSQAEPAGDQARA